MMYSFFSVESLPSFLC